MEWFYLQTILNFGMVNFYTFYYSSTMLTYFHSDAYDTGCFKGFCVEQDKGLGFAQLVDDN